MKCFRNGSFFFHVLILVLCFSQSRTEKYVFSATGVGVGVGVLSINSSMLSNLDSSCITVQKIIITDILCRMLSSRDGKVVCCMPMVI